MHNTNERYDFKAIGQAVKKARESQGLIREKVAEILELAPRYLMSIENTGQHPSLQKFYEIVTLFNISVDGFFFPDTTGSKNTRRRQLDAMIDGMDEKELSIITATARAILKAKETEEK